MPAGRRALGVVIKFVASDKRSQKSVIEGCFPMQLFIVPWDETPVLAESHSDQETIELLWKSPRYKFRVPLHDGSDGLLKEVAIDVTGSAPTFPEPSVFMCAAIEKALALLATISRPRILDVGAGKLRTTLYILRKVKTARLWAVEYEQLRNSSEQAKSMYKKAEGFKERFNSVVFPHEFIALSGGFDLAIVANVLGTMPIPAERLLLLQHCHQKVKKGGHLLWYSQHNEGDYAEGGSRCNASSRPEMVTTSDLIVIALFTGTSPKTKLTNCSCLVVFGSWKALRQGTT